MNLIRLENTDAWFVLRDKPPRDLTEALMDAEDIAWEDAHAMIDAGAATEQSQYLLEGGTQVIVYAITKKPDPTTD